MGWRCCPQSTGPAVNLGFKPFSDMHGLASLLNFVGILSVTLAMRWGEYGLRSGKAQSTFRLQAALNNGIPDLDGLQQFWRLLSSLRVGSLSIPDETLEQSEVLKSQVSNAVDGLIQHSADVDVAVKAAVAKAGAATSAAVADNAPIIGAGAVTAVLLADLWQKNGQLADTLSMQTLELERLNASYQLLAREKDLADQLRRELHHIQHQLVEKEAEVTLLTKTVRTLRAEVDESLVRDLRSETEALRAELLPLRKKIEASDPSILSAKEKEIGKLKEEINEVSRRETRVLEAVKHFLITSNLLPAEQASGIAFDSFFDTLDVVAAKQASTASSDAISAQLKVAADMKVEPGPVEEVSEAVDLSVEDATLSKRFAAMEQLFYLSKTKVARMSKVDLAEFALLLSTNSTSKEEELTSMKKPELVSLVLDLVAAHEEWFLKEKHRIAVD
eukprot:scaffold2709_cov163-Ochromonas_danica.AAC.16